MNLKTFIRYGFLYCIIALLWACASLQAPETDPPETAIQVESQPPGASIIIRETGRQIDPGETISLPAGRYTLVAEKKGYAAQEVSVEIDGQEARTIEIPMGKGFGTLLADSEPHGATVFVNNKMRGKTPLELDKIAEGEHVIEFRKEGYVNRQKNITVLAGEPSQISVELEAIPTSGFVIIRTRPQDGSIYMDGKKIGTGEVELPDLPFDNYTLQGALVTSPYERRFTETTLTHSETGPYTFTLFLDRYQRKIDDRWIDEKEALAIEQARYEQNRSDNPIGLKAKLSESAYQAITGVDGVAEILHHSLRVGDRIQFEYDNRTWLLWKRHDQITPEFNAAVEAFVAGNPHTDPWKADDPAAWALPADHQHILNAIVFGLHGSRGDMPLIDLGGEQLGEDHETIYRTKIDGPLTLVAEDGEIVSINGSAPPSPLIADLLVVHLPPDNSPLRVDWKQAPERLLVVSDASIDFMHSPDNRTLQVHEKTLVDLVEDREVKELVRISEGPDYGGWQRVRIKHSGPMADLINLNHDEIGPHQTAGTYRRIWLPRYIQEDGLSQRQLEAAYQVGGGIKDFESDVFLRRKERE
ncbi:MAG: PEGA domain-containing protein [Marinobacter sp.]